MVYTILLPCSSQKPIDLTILKHLYFCLNIFLYYLLKHFFISFIYFFNQLCKLLFYYFFHLTCVLSESFNRHNFYLMTLHKWICFMDKSCCIYVRSALAGKFQVLSTAPRRHPRTNAEHSPIPTASIAHNNSPENSPDFVNIFHSWFTKNLNCRYAIIWAKVFITASCNLLYNLIPVILPDI